MSGTPGLPETPALPKMHALPGPPRAGAGAETGEPATAGNAAQRPRDALDTLLDRAARGRHGEPGGTG